MIKIYFPLRTLLVRLFTKMPVATVTVRKLKNQLSGLDLSIPTIKEIPGILVDTVEYHVLVVSNLSFFKLPQHKETDVVQFVIPKHFEDFENLRKGLIIQYPGTVLPTLSSSILSNFLEPNTTERTAELQDFLKFIALTPKLATSHVTLEFLGVNPLTAGKYTNPKGTSDQEEGSSRKSSTSQPSRLRLFEEDEDESSDLFGSEASKDDAIEDEIFSTKSVSAPRRENIKLFEGPLADLDAAATAEDLKSLRLPSTEASGNSFKADTEDVSSLLKVEDDITQLLKLEEAVKSRQKMKAEPTSKLQSVHSTTDSSHHLVPTSPSSPLKPSLPPKPAVGKKPVLPQKPTSLHSADRLATSEAKKMENEKGKPATSELDLGDILKYINENPLEKEGERDLFS